MTVFSLGNNSMPGLVGEKLLLFFCLKHLFSYLVRIPQGKKMTPN